MQQEMTISDQNQRNHEELEALDIVSEKLVI